VNYYSIIYAAIDDVKLAVSGPDQAEVKEQIVGLARCARCSARASSARSPAALVVEGFIKPRQPGARARDHVVIHQGELDSLRRFKDDVSEVRAGTECGIGVVKLQRHRAGDQIECFARVEVARSA